MGRYTIPVGCVLPACYCISQHALWWCLLWGCLFWGCLLLESVCLGGVSAPGEAMSAPRDGVSATGEAMSAPRDGVSAPGEAISAPRDGVSAMGDGDVCSQGWCVCYGGWGCLLPGMLSLLLGMGVSAPRDGESATRDRGVCSQGWDVCYKGRGCLLWRRVLSASRGVVCSHWDVYPSMQCEQDDRQV